MCHGQYLKLQDLAGRQQEALTILAEDNEKLTEAYKQASLRSWWERPEVVVPLSIAIGLVGGSWASRR